MLVLGLEKSSLVFKKNMDRGLRRSDQNGDFGHSLETGKQDLPRRREYFADRACLVFQHLTFIRTAVSIIFLELLVLRQRRSVILSIQVRCEIKCPISIIIKSISINPPPPSTPTRWGGGGVLDLSFGRGGAALTLKP